MQILFHIDCVRIKLSLDDWLFSPFLKKFWSFNLNLFIVEGAIMLYIFAVSYKQLQLILMVWLRQVLYLDINS